MRAIITNEDFEKRKNYLANKLFEELKHKFEKTGDRKYVWLADKLGFDVDYKASDDEPAEPNRTN